MKYTLSELTVNVNGSTSACARVVAAVGVIDTPVSELVVLPEAALTNTLTE